MSGAGGAFSNETWEWDGSTWTKRAAVGPGARCEAAMAALGDRLILYGGGFSDETWLGRGGFFHSDQMRVLEKFTRKGNEILYEVTVDDPKMYTKPFKNTRVFVLMKPGEEILEYSCEENNKEVVEGHVTDAWTHK